MPCVGQEHQIRRHSRRQQQALTSSRTNFKFSLRRSSTLLYCCTAVPLVTYLVPYTLSQVLYQVLVADSTCFWSSHKLQVSCSTLSTHRSHRTENSSSGPPITWCRHACALGNNTGTINSIPGSGNRHYSAHNHSHTCSHVQSHLLCQAISEAL